ncbi:endolytic transglycosylase MltG [Candidatus Saccharibacteria bacterium]|nr:endolytic transglycosylase MltG [Candidatus Saccharibacteria bacterium]
MIVKGVEKVGMGAIGFIKWAVVVLAGLIVVAGVSAFVFYRMGLRPVDRDNESLVAIDIPSGESTAAIARRLRDAELIRNDRVFVVYARLNSERVSIQAGRHELSPSWSVSEIIERLSEATRADTFEVTFIPGSTIMDVREVLAGHGFSDAEIDAAFNAVSDHPVLRYRPVGAGAEMEEFVVGASLEGYIFGETYQFVVGASAEMIVRRALDELYQVIEENDLVARFRAVGERFGLEYEMNIHEALILASVIQKEVADWDEARQVAQVFLTRLAVGMPLGADPTFKYVANMMGVPWDIHLDSPYNTRIHAGLMPGPIAMPGLRVLLALADPAEGDYLFFVAGDDGITRFSRTLAEHEWLTQQYCRVLCFEIW